MQQGAMPAGVPRRGNGEKIGRQFHRVEAVHDPFSVGLCREFEAMDNARRTEACGIFVSIGDIVPVSQKDIAQAALFGKAARQVFHKAW